VSEKCNRVMEEVHDNGKESSHSARASGMNECASEGQADCMWVIPLWYGCVDTLIDVRQLAQLLVKTKYHRYGSMFRL
jgi:hypothetical protein